MSKKHRRLISNHTSETLITPKNTTPPEVVTIVGGNAAITTTSKVNNRFGKNYTYPKYEIKPPCHKTPTILFDQLMLGGSCGREMATAGADIIITLGGSISDFPKAWETWCGDVYAIPITDYSILPMDVLEIKVEQVVSWLKAGNKVGMFCIGGHGRTGYFASCVLGKWHPEILDPIVYIRENYCKKVVESTGQIDQIAEFLGNDAIKDNKPSKSYEPFVWDGYSAYAGGGNFVGWDGKTNSVTKSTSMFASDKKDTLINYCCNCGTEITNGNKYYCNACLDKPMYNGTDPVKVSEIKSPRHECECIYCGKYLTEYNESRLFTCVCLLCESLAIEDKAYNDDDSLFPEDNIDVPPAEECIYCHEPIDFKNRSIRWTNVCSRCEIIYDVKPANKEAK